MDKSILVKHGMKITPQRIAVIDAMNNLREHPTTDCIIDFIHKNHPNIATGTIYKTLDTFVSKGILRRVKTERDKMRYDSILETHHHLYCTETNRIIDFKDEKLDKILEDYFNSKKISNFQVEDVKLQISGKFSSNQT